MSDAFIAAPTSPIIFPMNELRRSSLTSMVFLHCNGDFQKPIHFETTDVAVRHPRCLPPLYSRGRRVPVTISRGFSVHGIARCRSQGRQSVARKHQFAQTFQRDWVVRTLSKNHS